MLSPSFLFDAGCPAAKGVLLRLEIPSGPPLVLGALLASRANLLVASEANLLVASEASRRVASEASRREASEASRREEVSEASKPCVSEGWSHPPL